MSREEPILRGCIMSLEVPTTPRESMAHYYTEHIIMLAYVTVYCPFVKLREIAEKLHAHYIGMRAEATRSRYLKL
jgi:hypothetical protein